MGIFIHGTSKVDIGIDELMIECPSCEAHNFADVMISSLYQHFYWIPFMPTGKEATVACKKCGLKRYGLDLKGRTLQNYKEAFSKFKHPYFTYIGVSLLVIIIIGALIDLIFNNHR